MADVTFEGSSDFERVKRDFDRLHRDMVKLREENKKLSDASRAASQQNAQARTQELTTVEKSLTNVAQLATGYFSVSQAINVVVGAYREWRAELKALGDEHTKVNKSIVTDLQGAGDLASGRQIEAFLAGGNATRAQNEAAFNAISGANPEGDLQRRMDLTSATTRMAPIEADLNALSTLVGELSKSMPETSAGDVADLAVVMRQMAGRNAERLGSDEFLRSIRGLEAAGFDQSMALGLGLESLRKNQSPEVLQALSAKLQTNRDPALRGLSAEDQLSRLLADPKVRNRVLGNELGAKFGTLDAERVQASRQQISQALAADYVGEQLNLANRMESGQQALMLQEGSVRKEQALRGEAQFMSQFETLQNQLDAANAERGMNWFMRSANRWVQQKEAEAYMLVADDPTITGYAIHRSRSAPNDPNNALVRELAAQLHVQQQTLEAIRGLQRDPVVVPAGPPER